MSAKDSRCISRDETSYDCTRHTAKRSTGGERSKC